MFSRFSIFFFFLALSPLSFSWSYRRYLYVIKPHLLFQQQSSITKKHARTHARLGIVVVRQQYLTDTEGGYRGRRRLIVCINRYLNRRRVFLLRGARALAPQSILLVHNNKEDGQQEFIFTCTAPYKTRKRTDAFYHRTTSYHGPPRVSRGGEKKKRAPFLSLSLLSLWAPDR